MKQSFKSFLFFLSGSGTIVTAMIVGTGFISPMWIIPGIIAITFTSN